MIRRITILLALFHLQLSMSFSSSFLGIALKKRLNFASYSSSGQEKIIHRYNLYHRHRYISTRTRITMMPEGPEVRSLTDQLQGGVGRRLLDVQFVSGRYVRNGKPDGFASFIATMSPLKGSSSQQQEQDQDLRPEPVDIIKSWRSKGKFSYIVLDNGGDKHPSDSDDFQRSIWITLGMTGKFVNEKIHNENPEHGRWYLELLCLETQKKTRIHYHDIRNFGTLKFCLSKEELNKKLESLGPDILEPATTTEDIFVNIISNKKNPNLNICKFLMDQSNLCGIGNYILAEGLYRAGLDPYASLKEFTEEQQRILFRELQSVALESYAAQGMTRQKGGVYRTVDGSKGRFEMQLQCYGRRFCPRGNPVIKDTSGPHGRTIWYTKDQLFMPLDDRLHSARPSEKSLSKKREEDTEKTTWVETADSKKPFLDSGWTIFQKATTTNDVDKSALLLSTLKDPGWMKVVSEEIKESDQFQELVKFIEQEVRSGQTVYPPHRDLFSALNLCPIGKVKVVLVGQDPYHGPGQGHGLAFSVRKGALPPPSLKNIFKEAIEDVGIVPPTHGNLEQWAKQGVLLLNSVLTVRRGDAFSHSVKGWEYFTDTIIQHLNDNKEGLVFLLFGNPAHKKASNVDETKHVLIRTSHPSPLGARKTATPFLGSRCFSLCNQILEEKGFDPIDWNIR